jgi:ketosteroid isomerase-like protein
MMLKAPIFLVTLIASVAAVFPTALMADNPSIPPATDQSTAGLDHLRASLKDAYTKGDVDAMMRYLHPDVVIIFPDGSILKGPEAFHQYYMRMMTAPDRRVVSYSANPEVESRTVHNDVGLSYGSMNDSYVLNDGRKFTLNSRFTVTVFKSPDGPRDTDGWMIRSFHSSVDTFDNPILTMVARGVFWRAGIGGLVIGIVLSFIVGILLARRRRVTIAQT